MRRTTLPRAALLFSALAFSAMCALVPAAARADGLGGLRGKIVVSDAEFGTDYGSDAAMAKAVRKQGKAALPGKVAWTLNLMVFFKQAPGASKIYIVYYDTTKRPFEQVNFSEVQVQPSQKILPINGVAISKDLGFVAGHTYEIRATRQIAGKEKVYAKGTVKLK